uniref:Peptidase M14 domain-containing protein n=1 Tax=Timema poppense TaxID=170557 RepID=A0A7R9CW65_TIMPO|nr:unnamed protein product [Timema poppensis]
MLDNIPFIKMYLTFHSFGQSFLYPWGHTKELPDDWRELDELARKAAEAIVKTGGPRFEVGSSSNVLSFGAGGADDFAKGRANIKYAYTVEMPGGGPNGFDLPATSLCLHLHSLYQGLRVMSQGSIVGSWSFRLDAVLKNLQLLTLFIAKIASNYLNGNTLGLAVLYQAKQLPVKHRENSERLVGFISTVTKTSSRVHSQPSFVNIRTDLHWVT